MKLRDKLKLSFLIMIVLPILLGVGAASAIFKFQSASVREIYENHDAAQLEEMYSENDFDFSETGGKIYESMRDIAAESVMAVLLILILTSLVLDVWLYSSIVKPLDKLKLAAQNIKMGNLDFEMPKISHDEIGDVCRDFEEMRVILKETSEQKLDSDREEKELIRNISHDLKTPLTAVKGYAQGLLDGVADTPEKQQRYIQTIVNKVNDMDKLIDELTIYSRLDTNRVPYAFKRINLKDYFDDCCDEINVDLEAQDIELVYNCHNVENVYVYADVEQLKRVINNIISNSVKYMQEGRRGRIGIDLYDEGDYAHIIMTDNGRGIGTAELPRIFERFYRTDASRNSNQGGSGIGLAIVRKIIEDHKGKIWAESVEGEGTTMHICLRKDDGAKVEEIKKGGQEDE
jgi:signal transduction histidine kinase